MSQNDFTIANQGFPAFRADLNSALQALASNSSGTTAPSTTFSNMWWYDSANNIMYIRNEDNDAWIKFAELDQVNDKFVLSGTLQLDDGTVSAPALTFNSDTNMGIYRGGTDILKFVTAGTDAITIDASQGVTLAGKLDVSSGTIKLDGNHPTNTGNVALGDTALDSLTSGNFNTGIGHQALTGATSGGNNTALGANAGTALDTGVQNVMLGRASGSAITSGNYNTSVGGESLKDNTTASNNTAVGYQALSANTTASNNTAVGYQALTANTTGSENVAVGQGALDANTTAGNNTAVGFDSLTANTTGGNHVAVGYDALENNTTGNSNVAIGFRSLRNNTTADNNTAVGQGALIANTTGAQNVAIGTACMSANTTGGENICMGVSALDANTTGSNHVALGRQALQATTTGNSNVAVGLSALRFNTTASNNTAVGYEAGYTNTASEGNVYLGYRAGKLQNNANAGLGYNTFLGYNSGLNLTSGYYNTFVGQGSGYLMTTGFKNVILGSYSGNQNGLDLRTSSNNIVLSDGDGNARFNYLSASKAWQIPYLGGTGTGRGSNTIISLNSGTTSYDGAMQITDAVANNVWWGLLGGNAYVMNNSNGVQLSSGATAWASVSDARLKTITGTYTNAVSDLSQIEAVKFTWNADENNTPQVGVIAQSVQAVVPEAMSVTIEDETEYLSVRYTELVPLMIAAIQEQQATITALEARIVALENA